MAAIAEAVLSSFLMGGYSVRILWRDKNLSLSDIQARQFYSNILIIAKESNFFNVAHFGMLNYPF